MQTIELTITRNKKPQEILKTLRQKRLKRGDKVRLKTKDNNPMFDSSLLFCLFVILWYLTEASNKKAFGEEIEEVLFNRKISFSDLERQIKKEFGVSIEHEDEDEKNWRELSVQNFLKGYADNEPEYTMADVKEPNPFYKKWKKEK